jgi:hypothetical protein
MVTDKKKEYWEDIIRKNPSAYEGQFVVHNETEIFFVHEDMMEAQRILRQYQAEGTDDLGVYLVPHHFNQIRLGAAFLKIPKIPDFILP